MKKFTVMILFLSMFFLCLGGAAKQLLTILQFHNELTASRRGVERKRTVHAEPRVFIKRQHPEIIPDPAGGGVTEGELMFQPLPSRISPDDAVTFPRIESELPREGSIEFSRVPRDKNVIIATPLLKEEVDKQRTSQK